MLVFSLLWADRCVRDFCMLPGFSECFLQECGQCKCIQCLSSLIMRY